MIFTSHTFQNSFFFIYFMLLFFISNRLHWASSVHLGQLFAITMECLAAEWREMPFSKRGEHHFWTLNGCYFLIELLLFQGERGRKISFYYLSCQIVYETFSTDFGRDINIIFRYKRIFKFVRKKNKNEIFSKMVCFI